MEYAARRGGAEAMSFETIIAAGQRSALPHGRASDGGHPGRGIRGLRLRCYTHWLLFRHDPYGIRGASCAETRARCTRRCGKRSRRRSTAVRPGVSVGEVDRAARKSLQK